MKIYPGLLDYFNERYMIVGEHWIWIGTHDVNGYGRIKFRGLRTSAHRVSLHLFKDLDVESYQLALHKCNRKNCVNPDHLYAGTHTDNMKDYVALEIRVNVVGHLCSKGLHMIADESDLYSRPDTPYKVCRQCKDIREKEWTNERRAIASRG